jgi:hypothetical protein
MLVATRDFKASDGELVRSGRTRISSDHGWAREHRDAFVEDPDGPPSDADTRFTKSPALIREARSERSNLTTRSVKRRRMPLREELAVRAAVVARIDRDRDRRDHGVRHGPSAEDLFWSDTQYMLETPAKREQRIREEREDREADEVAELIAQQAQAEVDEACRYWTHAPWD